MVGIATSQRLATCCRRMIPGLLVYYPSGLRPGEEEGGKIEQSSILRSGESTIALISALDLVYPSLMPTITLKAHFDGEHIRLDEPYELTRDTPLIVTILSPSLEEEHAEWARLSATSLSHAYGANEPEYSLSDVKS
jgi:hypothetical protein